MANEPTVCIGPMVAMLFDEDWEAIGAHTGDSSSRATGCV